MGLLNQKINNVIYDFSCITLNIAGMEFRGIQSISWNDARDHQVIYGADIMPMGVTPGQYSGTGSLEFLMSEYKNLTMGLTRLFESEWSCTCLYTLGNELPIRETLPKCIFNARSGDMSKGSDALTKKLDFILLDAVELDNTSPNAESSSLLSDIFRGANVVQNVLASF